MQHGEAVPGLSKLGEDHAAMRTNRDAGGRTVCSRDNELGRHEASRRDLANPAAPDLAKPEIAVGACGNAVGLAGRGRNRKLGNGPVDGNSADLLAVWFREPKVAVRASRDVKGRAGGSGNGEFRDRTGWRDFGDLVSGSGELREPEVAVRTGRDPHRLTVGRGDEDLAQNCPVRRDPADLVATALDEPQGAIGPSGNPERLAVARRDDRLTEEGSG